MGLRSLWGRAPQRATNCYVLIVDRSTDEHTPPPTVTYTLDWTNAELVAHVPPIAHVKTTRPNLSNVFNPQYKLIEENPIKIYLRNKNFILKGL